MSKKRGLSIEEKRDKLLALFYEEKELFQLKELEKIAPKRKGIISQSVKDVLQMLVDDNLVDTDKIGTMVGYWAFPSKALNTRQCRLDDLQQQMKSAQEKSTLLNQQIQQNSTGKEQSTEREELSEKVSDLENELKNVKDNLEQLAENDPETLNKKQIDAKKTLAAANRWTDNVMSTKHWCRSKFGMEESTLDKQFGIPEDFDYVE